MKQLITMNGEAYKYPATVATLRKLCPDTSIPTKGALPITIGVYTLLEPVATVKPTGDIVKEIHPVDVDGLWLQTWEVTEIPLADTQTKAFEALANIRYSKEVGGTEFNGIAVSTDRESQNKLIAGRTLAKESSDYFVSWKVSSGVFIDLDATAMIAIADVVRVHVQTCYSVEKLISEMIAACETNAEVDAVDLNDGWP